MVATYNLSIQEAETGELQGDLAIAGTDKLRVQ